MGCYLKVKNQPFFLYRGNKVERKSQATYYLNAYSAETMQIRWEAAHKGQKLEIRKWQSDELIVRPKT